MDNNTEGGGIPGRSIKPMPDKSGGMASTDVRVMNVTTNQRGEVVPMNPNDPRSVRDARESGEDR